MTVAFASPGHADAALRFIARSSLAMTATRRPVGHDEDMALVDIEIRRRDRVRLDTLLLGVHAFVVKETPAGTAVARAVQRALRRPDGRWQPAVATDEAPPAGIVSPAR